MKEVAERENFEVSSLPHNLILAARKSDGDVNLFCEDVEFDFPDVSMTKEQARQVMAYVANEDALDVVAGAPSSSEALDRLIDDSMYREIKRLNREVKCLSKIADMDPDKDVKIIHTGEVINAIIAKSRLVLCMSNLKEYSKILSEKTKAKNSGSEATSVNVNMQFNMQDMVTEGLQRLSDTLDVPTEES